MTKRRITITIMLLGLFGLSAQAIHAQVQRSNSISQWEKLKPKIVDSFNYVGDENLIESLKGRVVDLMEQRATLSNVDAQTAQRDDLESSPDIQNTVEQNVAKVWSSRNLENRTSDIIAGWNIAKLDPNYRPFIQAKYDLDSWQGIRVADDGRSAYAVLTGTMTYVYDDSVVRDSLDQTQLTVVKENGIWLLDDTVAVFTGQSK